MKFIPQEKRSKKRRREENQKMRRDWGAISPVTRTGGNAKVYDRKKLRPPRAEERE